MATVLRVCTPCTACTQESLAFTVKPFIFAVISVRNSVVAGTRGRLNTQENGAEGISVLHAVFVCKIWKAWRVTIDWFGTLTTSVGCSVIQCTYRAAQTLAEQQNNLRRADSRIGNTCPNRKLYGDQLYVRNSTDTSKKGTVRYICVILYT